MHQKTQELTALCLMNTAKAAREDIRAGRFVQARRHIMTIYHIAGYAASDLIGCTAVEELLRIESDLNAEQMGEQFRHPRLNAVIIPFPVTDSEPDLPPTHPGLGQLAGYAA